MSRPRDRQFILAAVCPRCGWRPAIRTFAAMVEAALDLDPETPCMSMKCQRRGCETTYIITARAYHNARAA
jgi:hypothetical protein